MGDTKIEWADKSWNYVTGCDDKPKSPACERCYAKRLACSPRLRGRYGYPQDNPFRPGTLHCDKLADPLKWRTSKHVFVSSMGDLFHEAVADDIIATVFGIMAACPQHTFMVLTKRIERALSWFEWVKKKGDGYDLLRNGLPSELLHCAWEANCGDAWDETEPPDLGISPTRGVFGDTWPLPNVIFGVTAENQEMADERIPLLVQTPAAKRFVSCEPLLGPIWISPDHLMDIDLVACGGETGPGARPMDLAWARSLAAQCAAAPVSFFFKKVGKGQETPDDLKIREWPEEKAAQRSLL